MDISLKEYKEQNGGGGRTKRAKCEIMLNAQSPASRILVLLSLNGSLGPISCVFFGCGARASELVLCKVVKNKGFI